MSMFRRRPPGDDMRQAFLKGFKDTRWIAGEHHTGKRTYYPAPFFAPRPMFGSHRGLVRAAYIAGSREFEVHSVAMGRNIGSFRGRQGEWKKGAGGRFVGSRG